MSHADYRTLVEDLLRLEARKHRTAAAYWHRQGDDRVAAEHARDAAEVEAALDHHLSLSPARKAI